MLHMILLFGSLALGGLFLWFFVWAVRGGQFKDPEEAKYLMFREDDDEEAEFDAQVKRREQCKTK
ncbi:MAG: cbb3-type cytochrome oxidase assembly protein CcoS [Lentisphaerae bacterium]|nr:cbb3-type cytochrome oxidase assembly protein CcoS [Lentisphaerota bacterium]